MRATTGSAPRGRGRGAHRGYFYAFTLRTDFGELTPVGLDLLRKRVEETQALVALQEAVEDQGLHRFVWGKDPEELRKANEAGLKALGVSDEVAAEFLRNDAFTPTDQTRFVAALAAVKAKGLADYLGTARNARSPREALFFVASAEMLKRQHAESAVSAVLTDCRAMVALSGGRAVVLFPLDYVAWTDPFAATATEIAGRATKELGATVLEMQVTGQVSTRARREIQALGWTLKEASPAGE